MSIQELCVPLLTLIPLLTPTSLPEYKYYSYLVSYQTFFYEYSKQSHIHMFICIHTYFVYRNTQILFFMK